MKIFILALLAFAFTTAGCSKSNLEDKRNLVIFLSGDPMQMINNTKKNKKSFINKDNYFEFENEYEFDGVSSYYDKYLLELPPKFLIIDARPHPSAKERNAVQDNPLKDRPPFSINISQVRYKKYQLKIYSPSLDLFKKLDFEENSDGTLDLIQVNDYPVSVEHYSSSTDNSNHSILFSTEHYRNFKGKRIKTTGLHHLRITKKYNRNNIVKEQNSEFNYLYGSGVKIKWKKPVVKINLCGDDLDGHRQEIIDGVNQWKPYTKKFFQYELIEKSICTPFSDLVENNIIFTKDLYRQGSQGTLGVTYMAVNIPKQELISGSIILFDKVMRDPRVTGNVYNDVSGHEFGHFIGLHHKFKKNTENANNKIDSMMGYDDYSLISDYDQRAVADLYN